jgi:hypothetical protein
MMVMVMMVQILPVVLVVLRLSGAPLVLHCCSHTRTHGTETALVTSTVTV